MFTRQITLSPEEREFLEELVVEGVPDKLRGKFWVACTGARAYKSGYCDNYYDTICMAEEYGTWKEYPNNHFRTIKKDIPRTFMDD